MHVTECLPHTLLTKNLGRFCPRWRQDSCGFFKKSSEQYHAPKQAPVSMAQVQIPETLPDLPGKSLRQEDPRLKLELYHEFPLRSGHKKHLQVLSPIGHSQKPNQENSLWLCHLKILAKLRNHTQKATKT